MIGKIGHQAEMNMRESRSSDDKGNLQHNVKISSDDEEKIKTRFRVQAVQGYEKVTEINQSIRFMQK